MRESAGDGASAGAEEAQKVEANLLGDMSEHEFEALLDIISASEFDHLSLPSFMDTLWALEAAQTPDVIEVTATIEGEILRLTAPDGVIVHGHEIIVNGKRIVVKLAETKSWIPHGHAPSPRPPGCVSRNR
jgi:hypothetical protein